MKEKLKNKKIDKKKENENKDPFKKSNFILKIASSIQKCLLDKVKFGDVVDQPPELTAFPILKKRQISAQQLTIPEHVKTKSGVTEKDRNEVIQKYRALKQKGKFN